jgi:SAM-dependent methyltransferase
MILKRAKALTELRHQKIPSDLFQGKNVLDIGCGRHKLPGAVGLDHMALPGVDIVADLNQPLPIEDEAFEVVHADNVLEHIENLISLVYEVHRILKPGGQFLIHVPYFRSSWSHIDPTHVRCFTIQTMNYFIKDSFEYEHLRFDDQAFETLEVFIDNHEPSTLLRKFLVSYALRNPGYFENSYLSTLFPFISISYLLTK